MTTDIEPQQTESSLGRLPLICVLVIQVLVGYEWLNSGLTKIVRGGFPNGLAPDLHERLATSAGWYRHFVDGSILPHAVAFGYLIEISELLVGVALIAAAILWLFRWEWLPEVGRLVVLGATIVAALAATLMAVNFHLANGGTHPWLIPKSGFDESVDLDALLPAIQVMFVVLSVGAWRSLRRAAPARAAAPARLHLSLGHRS